jgi:thiol:disulfide interchange protein DsbD
MKKTGFKAFLLLFAAAVVAPQAWSAEDEPLPPREAYRYAIWDTGDALEIDWAVEDDYYLYRNQLAFESRTDGVVLGTPRMPEGIAHEDEFFGKQQVYREKFYVSIPYRVDGERPATMELVIKSRGCWDGGVCYMPQEWTEEVELKAKAEPKLELGSIGAGASLTGGPGGEFLPVDEAFRPILIPVDGNNIDVTFRIAPDYYLYKEKLSVKALADNVQLGDLDLPKGKDKYDEFFGEQEVYYDEVFARLPIARATPEAMELQLEIGFQGCAEAGLCYPPQTRVMTVQLPAATTVTDLSAVRPMVSDQDQKANIITGASIWTIVASFFGFGLLLAFTPCVLPMIPILTSIIAGEGKDTSPMRGFILAFSYVMGMAIVYTAAGVVAVAAGAQVQAAFNQPWVLSLFAALFVVLAAAMFGGYDLQMPSSVQSKLAGISANQKSGTLIGAFIMGALSSLIVTACVAPALVAALAVMSQSGDYLRGGVALFAMALGMGAPLLLVGAAQGKFLPKVGPWMMAVKGAFGFMLLGLAIWMLSRFLPGSLVLAMWAVLAVMTGVFMGGLTSLTPESSAGQKTGKGLGFLLIVYGLLMLLGSLTGGSNPLKPLSSVNLGGGVAIVEDEHLEFTRIKTVDDLDRELEAAVAAGKTAMLDFYADWCVSCIEMEEYTFTDANVQAALSNTAVLQADVTANDDQDKELLARFGVFGPPTIIFFGTDGQQRHGYEVVGYMKADDFVAHLNKAFEL